MINLNVFDIVFDAVEEHNRYVNKPDKRDRVRNLSKGELKGLFYNTLRRRVGSFGHFRNSYSALHIDDIECYFNEKGELVNYSVTKKFTPTYLGWDGSDAPVVLEQVKKIGNEIPFFYPTRVLNEMALIVNSIK